jgi:hypothetical protein
MLAARLLHSDLDMCECSQESTVGLGHSTRLERSVTKCQYWRRGMHFARLSLETSCRNNVIRKLCMLLQHGRQVEASGSRS